MTINQKISIAVLAKVAEGLRPVEALKAICGEEKVDAMISELYNELLA